MKIGVLALQGDFREHIEILKKLNVEPIEVRTKEQLNQVNGLIIPGGESTTISKLLIKYKLDKEIIKKHKSGMPIYGTCAGAILLATEIVDFPGQTSLKLIDISVQRNAYGRQIDSFEAPIKVKDWKTPFHAIFIRAPIIKKIRNSTKIIAKHGSEPVLLTNGKILISTFHPELAQDTRIHKLFLEMI